MMEGRVEKRDHQHLSGVKCIVNTCYYNAGGNYCSAAKIEIQPNNANSTEETDCATFMKK